MKQNKNGELRLLCFYRTTPECNQYIAVWVGVLVVADLLPFQISIHVATQSAYLTAFCIRYQEQILSIQHLSIQYLGNLIRMTSLLAYNMSADVE